MAINFPTSPVLNDTYSYGPLTQEEVDAIVVPKSLIPEPDGYYVGTYQEQPQLENKKLFKWVPPTIEE